LFLGRGGGTAGLAGAEASSFCSARDIAVVVISSDLLIVNDLLIVTGQARGIRH
jgi:hypothetical protein